MYLTLTPKRKRKSHRYGKKLVSQESSLALKSELCKVYLACSFSAAFFVVLQNGSILDRHVVISLELGAGRFHSRSCLLIHTSVTSPASSSSMMKEPLLYRS